MHAVIWFTLLAVSPIGQDSTHETRGIEGARWKVQDSDPLHRVLDLDLSEDPAIVTHPTTIDGRLSVWLESPQPGVRFQAGIDGDDGIKESSIEETGATPWLMIPVTPGRELVIQLSSQELDTIPATLHVVGIPETAVTRAADEKAQADLSEIRGVMEAGKLREAREQVSAVVVELMSCEGGRTSASISFALWEAGGLAWDLQSVRSAEVAWSAFLEASLRYLPVTHEHVLMGRENVAVASWTRGDLQRAIELLETSVELREQRDPADHPNLVQAKGNLAALLSSTGNIQRALHLERELLEARLRIYPEDHPRVLASKFNLATCLFQLEAWSEAQSLLEDVFDVQSRTLTPGDLDLLKTKSVLARLAKELGDTRISYELGTEALEGLSRVLPADHPDLLTAMLNHSNTLAELGDQENALGLREEVLAARERLLPPEHPDRLKAIMSIAQSRSSLGDANGARELQQDVLRLRLRALPEDHPDVLTTKSNLGATLYDLGEYAGSHELFLEVYEAWSSQLDGDNPILLKAMGNLARSSSMLGDAERALELSKQVHDSFSRQLSDDHLLLLLEKHSLAMLLGSMGRHEEAAALQRHVLDSLEETRRSGNLLYRLALQNHAATQNYLEDYEGLASTCRSLLEQMRRQADGLQFQAPRAAREGALRELERLDWLDMWGERLETHDEPSIQADLFVTLEQLRFVSTANTRVARAARDHPELSDLLARLQEASRMAAAVAQSPPPRHREGGESASEAWRAEIVRAAEQRDGLQRRLRTAVGQSSLAPDLLDLRAIASRLGDDEVVVSYWCHQRKQELGDSNRYESIESLRAYVLHPTGDLQSVELGTTRDLSAWIAEWREAIGSPLLRSSRGLGAQRSSASKEANTLGARIRSRILDPIVSCAPDARRIHIITDDVLHLVPLDALPRAEGLVGEDLDLRIHTSLVSLATPGHDTDGELSLLVVGGVDYAREGVADEASLALVSSSPARGTVTGSFQPLPGTRQEVISISQSFEQFFQREGTSLFGGEATKSRLFELAPAARFLHIATHGWFTPASEAISMIDSVSSENIRSSGRRPDLLQTQEALVGYMPETLCGLALAGANRGDTARERMAGIVTAEELATLDLTNCELAVLSACETNVGIRRAGQGIQSLQSALHAAGARLAITSLWNVDDEATRQLFEVFYRKLWLNGLDAHQALWEAKMKLRAAGQPTRNWAGWVLTGEVD